MSELFDYYQQVQEAVNENREKAAELAQKGQEEIADAQSKAQMKDILGGVFELKATMLGKSVFDKIPFKKISDKVSENVEKYIKDKSDEIVERFQPKEELEGIELDDLAAPVETLEAPSYMSEATQNYLRDVMQRAPQRLQVGESGQLESAAADAGEAASSAIETVAGTAADAVGSAVDTAAEVATKAASIGSKVVEGAEGAAEAAEGILDAFGIGEVLQLATAIGFGIGGEKLMKHKKAFQDMAQEKVNNLNPAAAVGIYEQ